MRKIFYFASLVCLALFSACSSDSDDNTIEGNNGKYKTVNLNIGLEGTGSRVAFGEDITKVTWEEGDPVFFQGYDNDNTIHEASFSRASAGRDDSGKNSFAANGVTLNTWAQKFRVYHYSERTSSKVKVNEETKTIDQQLNAQVQDAVNDPKHINRHMVYRASKLVDGQEQYFLTLADIENKSITLKPNSCVLDLNILNLPKVVADAGQYQVDLYINQNMTSANSPVASLTYNGKITSGQPNRLFIAFKPTTLKNGNNICIEVTANGKTVKAYHKATKDNEYKAAEALTAELNYQETNVDGWTWELPTEKEIGIYTSFNGELFGWTDVNRENGNGVYPVRSDEDGHLNMSLQHSNNKECFSVISPKFYLGKKSNTLTFYYNVAVRNDIDTRFLIKIRKFADNKDMNDANWKTITIPTYNIARGFHLVSIDLSIDCAELFGNDVQIALQMRGDKGTTVKNTQMNIREFKVVGE